MSALLSLAQEAGPSPWWIVLGRVHPLVLHFPLALVAVLALIELGGGLVRRRFPRPAILVLLWLNAVFAGLAAVSGLELAAEGGYDADALTMHQVLGVCAAGACGLLALLASVFASRAVYRWSLALTLLLVVPAGHYGASLTHGDDFLSGPLQDALEGKVKPPPKPRPQPEPPPAVQPVVPAGNGAATPNAAQVSYLRDIAPLMEKYCASCHGPKKHKADLRLDSPTAIKAGSENGPVIEPGNAAKSFLWERMTLPLEHDDRMPPEGKPQLTPEQMELVRRWLDEGASFDGEPPPSQVAPDPDGDKAGERPKTPAPPPGEGQAVLQAARARLAEALVHAAPLSQGSDLLRIDCAPVAETIDDAAAARLLTDLAPVIGELSLARTRVTDASMPLIGTMTGLRRLDLRASGVTMAGLRHLRGLGQLRELVLAETPLLEALRDDLLALPALEKVYLWNTGLGEAAVSMLRQRQGLVVDAGLGSGDPVLEIEPEVKLGPAPAPAGPAADPTKPLPAPAAMPVNDVCPVSGKPVDPAFTLVHEGRTIGFCCPNCPKPFQQDPGKYPVKPRN